MLDLMNDLRRTHYAEELSLDDVGKEVVVAGWVANIRDMGSLVFGDLRDRSGYIQFVVNNENKELLNKSQLIKSEYVVMIKAIVLKRKSPNPDLKTGQIELEVLDIKILDKANTPPIYIKDDDNAQENIKLKYRYLDLRKPRMQNILAVRSKLANSFRNFLSSQGFIEVETPILAKPTPEGARDYLVPSRVNPGNFYALPQSPQIFKQLLMVSGVDRYYQIAKCFRDEDLRANRQPEFTQVDIEMSFIDQKDILSINEKMMKYVFKEMLNKDIQIPFKQMSYQEAMERFGSDKPDLRYGYEIQNIDEINEKIDFNLFNDAIKNNQHIYAINFNGLANEYSRKKIDKLTEYVKGNGGKGLLWVKKIDDQIQSSFSKFLTEESTKKLDTLLKLDNNDIAFIMVGEKRKTLSSMGILRTYIAKNHLDLSNAPMEILWIVDFPMFEYDEDEDRYVAQHHPFTMPLDEHVPLLDTNPEKVLSKAYDLVINGEEAGGGSIRIHNSEIQEKIFNILKLSKEEISTKFGFFTEALKYGTPPHGGIAYGLDRFVMQLVGTDNIKDVIAFPKNQSAQDIMSDCPTMADTLQLEELKIKIDE